MDTDNELLFKERVIQRIDLDDPQIKRATTKTEFKDAVLAKYLTGHTTAPRKAWFWKHINQSSGLDKLLRRNELFKRAREKLHDPKVKGRVRSIRAGTKYRGLGVSETLREGIFSGKAIFKKNYLYFYKEELDNKKVLYRDLLTGKFIKQPKGMGTVLKFKKSNKSPTLQRGPGRS